ncbi:hypothetical protein [Silvibacterium dinghuense]|uniref:Uncharacterized protein n=1 Tax=Silvibacterium dinghuense TaxID=1560006 RepID=A0A4Q1SJP6_9BACT|nr:hypothetical protein [Silvibacterium dinghuense]RXS97876.1 hypothetical protein ESZ00_08460 [Silvibacterium dinghuense]GGH02656.1 hypothetical protein GCM10011586_18120 [Silvibacterium dinghuense]
MTDEERDALLIDLADGLRIVLADRLGMTGSLALHPRARVLHDRLAETVEKERLRGISDPHNILKLQK